jgi:hypothetical protein
MYNAWINHLYYETTPLQMAHQTLVHLFFK